MTGYGNAKGSSSSVDLEVSVKAVNGRFFDLRCHVPKEYSGMENEIKKMVSQSIKRGTVDVYINRRSGAGSLQAEVKVQTSLARKWLKTYRQLGKDLRLPDDVTLELVARQPEVLTVVQEEKVSAQEKKLLLTTLKKTVANCQKEREREGLSLQKDLLDKFRQLEKLTEIFIKLRSQANEELGKRYQQRLSQFKKGEIDPQRLAQEIVIQVDKADINEEIIRLKEHLRAMKALVTTKGGRSKESQGKKLDFYSQELLREVNTIGSKSQIARLTQSVVDAKAIIERIREQVQNIE